jgi:hypothetical protein
MQAKLGTDWATLPCTSHLENGSRVRHATYFIKQVNNSSAGMLGEQTQQLSQNADVVGRKPDHKRRKRH